MAEMTPERMAQISARWEDEDAFSLAALARDSSQAPPEPGSQSARDSSPALQAGSSAEERPQVQAEG